MGRRNQTAAQRQESIFKYIKEFLMENGYPPSVREIGVAVGLRSSSTVHAYLDMLEDRGLIRRDPAKPRAIDILDEKPWSNNVSVPLLHKITAGENLLAEENVEEMLQIPAEFFAGSENGFVVCVADNSMVRSGIRENDYLLLEGKAEPHNGDTVLAQLEDGTTVIRRYSVDKRGIHLQPDCDGMKGCYVKKVTVLGRALGIYRRF